MCSSVFVILQFIRKNNFASHVFIYADGWKQGVAEIFAKIHIGVNAFWAKYQGVPFHVLLHFYFQVFQKFVWGCPISSPSLPISTPECIYALIVNFATFQVAFPSAIKTASSATGKSGPRARSPAAATAFKNGSGKSTIRQRREAGPAIPRSKGGCAFWQNVRTLETIKSKEIYSNYFSTLFISRFYFVLQKLM
jgi:hypothetical protein